MKRILSFILSVSVIAAMFCMQASAEAKTLSNSYNDQLALLTKLNIMDTVSETEANSTAVLRGEFANYIAALLRLNQPSGQMRYYRDVPMDHWAYDAINSLTERNVIAGSADELFRPSDAITCDEAIKIALCSAGYGNYAEIVGGFPKGYRDVAAKLDMTLTGSDRALSVKDAVTLLYELLNVKIYEMEGISEGLPKFGESNDTMLYRYYDMYTLEGVITYAQCIALDGLGMEPEGVIRIDGVSYETELDLMNNVGRRATFVCLEDKNGRDTVVIMNTESKRDKQLEIDKSDFVDYQAGANTLTYSDEKNADCKVKLSAGAVVVKNGMVYDKNIAAAFNFDKGYIRLSDHNGDGTYEYVVIYAYENFVIDFIDTQNGEIYDLVAAGKKVALDEEIGTRRTIIKDASGNVVPFSKLAPGQVLSVCESDEFVLATISENVVTGTVFSRRDSDDDGIELQIGKNISDTMWYKIDKAYYESAFGDTATISLNTAGDFYIDAYGNIAYAKFSNVSDWHYAYLAKYAKEEGTENVYLKLFVDDNHMETYNVASKVNIDGNRVRKENVRDLLKKSRYGNTLANGEDEIAGQLLRVKINNDNEINAIDTLYRDTMSEGSQSLMLSYGPASLAHKYHANSFYGKFCMDGNTKYFLVPELANTTEANNDDFKIVPVSYFWSKTSTVAAYRLDEEAGCESVVVAYSGSSSTLSDSYYLVEKITESVNADNEIVKSIRAWSSGVAYDFNTTSDYDLSFEVTENEEVNKYYVEPGDIIRIYTNIDGTIDNVSMVYDYSRRDDENYNRGWSNVNKGDIYTDRGNLMYAYIKNIKNNIMRVTYSMPNYTTNPLEADYMAPLSNGAIMIFDETARNKVTIGNKADLRSAENVGEDAKPYMLYLNCGVFRGAIIYR